MARWGERLALRSLGEAGKRIRSVEPLIAAPTPRRFCRWAECSIISPQSTRRAQRASIEPWPRKVTKKPACREPRRIGIVFVDSRASLWRFLVSSQKEVLTTENENQSPRWTALTSTRSDRETRGPACSEVLRGKKPYDFNCLAIQRGSRRQSKTRQILTSSASNV